jgi:hypothetical protein
MTNVRGGDLSLGIVVILAPSPLSPRSPPSPFPCPLTPFPAMHRIRLKGPWEVIAPGGDAFERIDVPVAWRDLFGDRSGTARFRRRFHAPTNLDEGERVVIRIPLETGEVRRFTCNETPVPELPGDPLAFDVTGPLQSFNELQFEITFDPHETPNKPGGLWEAVCLEIRPQ